MNCRNLGRTFNKVLHRAFLCIALLKTDFTSRLYILFRALTSTFNLPSVICRQSPPSSSKFAL